MLRFNPTSNPGMPVHQWARLQAYNIMATSGPKGKKFLSDNIRNQDGEKIFELRTWEKIMRDIRKGAFVPAKTPASMEITGNSISQKISMQSHKVRGPKTKQNKTLPRA